MYKNMKGSTETIELILILTLLTFILYVGASICRYGYDRHIEFYNTAYKPEYSKCVAELPRNQDCVYVSMNFKIIDKNNR